MEKFDADEMLLRAMELVSTPIEQETHSDGIAGMLVDINEYLNDSGRPISLSAEKNAVTGEWVLVIYDTMDESSPTDGKKFKSEHDITLYLDGFRRALQAVREADGE